MAETRPAVWHSRPVADVVDALRTSPAGLSAEDAATRRAEHGLNVVRLAPPTPAWRILLDQFRSIIVALLGAAALVAWMTADAIDAIAIGVVLALNV
ncbi:MAG: cation-transporting P-type ATPase, partial [Acidobacteria bacterium]|nr:cation-transporting P-type ATPase [Acidobacteriota bacterium]